MKILYIPGYRYPDNLKEPITCGDLRYSFNLTRSLCRLGHEVIVISRKKDNDKDHSFLDGVEIYRYKSELGRFLSKSFDISYRRKKLFDEFKKNVDLIICNSALSLELLSSIDQPIFYICSGLEDIKNYNWAPNEIISALAIKLLRDPCKQATWEKASIVNTTAEYESQTLLSWGIPSEKIRGIGPGVELTRYSPKTEAEDYLLRTIHNVSTDTNIILSVSRFTKAKGILLTLEGFKLLLEKKPDSVLFLIGVQHSHSPKYHQSVLDSIYELGLKENVILLENVSEYELPKYYSMADICTVFSVGYDPLPTVIIESMACGTPVVSTYYKTREQMIEDDINGIFISEGNIKSWVRQIVRILENETIRQRLIENGLSIINKKFNMDSITQKYINLFSSLQ